MQSVTPAARSDPEQLTFQVLELTFHIRGVGLYEPTCAIEFNYNNARGPTGRRHTQVKHVALHLFFGEAISPGRGKHTFTPAVAGTGQFP